MPITENKFTADELKAAATANPELINVVKGYLTTDAKMIVRTEDENKIYETNFEARIAANVTSQHAQKLEADVKELTGVDKTDANEKYYDYFKRATKQALESVNTVKAELETLRGKANLTEAEKARIQQLQQAVIDKENTWKEKYTALEKKNADIQAESLIRADLAKLRQFYKPDLPASVIQILEENAVKELLATSSMQGDGVLTFLNDKKEVIVDPTLYKPKTAEAILKEKFKDIIDPGKKQEGAGSSGAGGAQGGSGGGANGAQGGSAFAWAGIPAGVKSQTGLTKHLISQGILQDSKEWLEIQQKPEVQKLPIREPQ
jgi:hypothetical protein